MRVLIKQQKHINIKTTINNKTKSPEIKELYASITYNNVIGFEESLIMTMREGSKSS